MNNTTLMVVSIIGVIVAIIILNVIIDRVFKSGGSTTTSYTISSKPDKKPLTDYEKASRIVMDATIDQKLTELHAKITGLDNKMVSIDMLYTINYVNKYLALNDPGPFPLSKKKLLEKEKQRISKDVENILKMYTKYHEDYSDTNANIQKVMENISKNTKDIINNKNQIITIPKDIEKYNTDMRTLVKLEEDKNKITEDIRALVSVNREVIANVRKKRNVANKQYIEMDKLGEKINNIRGKIDLILKGERTIYGNLDTTSYNLKKAKTFDEKGYKKCIQDITEGIDRVSKIYEELSDDEINIRNEIERINKLPPEILGT